jgi:hypothetical protein
MVCTQYCLGNYDKIKCLHMFSTDVIPPPPPCILNPWVVKSIDTEHLITKGPMYSKLKHYSDTFIRLVNFKATLYTILVGEKNLHNYSGLSYIEYEHNFPRYTMQNEGKRQYTLIGIKGHDLRHEFLPRL